MRILRFMALVFVYGISAMLVRAQVSEPVKIVHAEPLYFDLARDLGARKGEKEVNIGVGFTGNKNYDQQFFLAEYEFAPVNRLGMEIELDFSCFRKTKEEGVLPESGLECLKLSAQYSFWVSQEHNATLAVGYTQIVEVTGSRKNNRHSVVPGTIYSPFFVGAKRWGNQWHTLIYIYPQIEHHTDKTGYDITWNWNTSFLYTIPQTKNFVGVEWNKEMKEGHLNMGLRPQMKMKLNDKMTLGIVTGFPCRKDDEKFSSFFRIIYEPG